MSTAFSVKEAVSETTILRIQVFWLLDLELGRGTKTVRLIELSIVQYGQRSTKKIHTNILYGWCAYQEINSKIKFRVWSPRVAHGLINSSWTFSEYSSRPYVWFEDIGVSFHPWFFSAMQQMYPGEFHENAAKYGDGYFKAFICEIVLCW